MRNMRLLLPLRSSETRSTGSGLSARAISWISSGGREDCITNFAPGGILLELVLGVAAEQDLAAVRRHFRMGEHVGKVVDEEIAVERAVSASPSRPSCPRNRRSPVGGPGPPRRRNDCPPSIGGRPRASRSDGDRDGRAPSCGSRRRRSRRGRDTFRETRATPSNSIAASIRRPYTRPCRLSQR